MFQRNSQRKNRNSLFHLTLSQAVDECTRLLALLDQHKKVTRRDDPRIITVRPFDTKYVPYQFMFMNDTPMYEAHAVVILIDLKRGDVVTHKFEAETDEDGTNYSFAHSYLLTLRDICKAWSIQY